MAENKSKAYVSENARIFYQSGKVVYCEELFGGRIRTLGYEDVQSENFVGFKTPDGFLNNNCFALCLNGTDLVFDYEFLNGTAKNSFFVNEEKDGSLHAVLCLVAKEFNVAVKVHTLLFGGDVMQRYIEVENQSNKPVALGKTTIFGGGIFSGKNPASVGYFHLANWCDEGDYHTEKLPVGTFAFCRENYNERYRQPFCICTMPDSDKTFICQMAYSGGFEMRFDTNLRKDGGIYDVEFSAALSGPAPLKMIDAGETFVSPEVAFGFVKGNADEAIYEMHKYARARYAEFSKTMAVEAAVGPETGKEEHINAMIKYGAKLGAEIFYIDAGWYIKKGRDTADWPGPCGDWTRTPDRYTKTLDEFREICHSLGMKFGLWLDVEKLGFESETYKKKLAPRLVGYDGKDLADGPAAAMLDITDPEGERWAYEQIKYVLDTYKLDYFRLDSGTFPPNASKMVSGHRENASLRYYEIWYNLFKKLRKEYPNVIFQNCSGGGMRCDLGMTGIMSNTWISDNHASPDSFGVLNGMSMMLPPEYLVKILYGMGAEKEGTLDFALNIARFGSPLIASFFIKENYEMDEETAAKVSAMIKSYKKYIRPMLENCRVYHHTPEVNLGNKNEWGVLEFAAEDKKTALLGVFTLGEVEKGKATKMVKFLGVDADLSYGLYCNDVFVGEKSGAELLSGFECHIPKSLDAKCFIATAL